jgi:hypothetical protein
MTIVSTNTVEHYVGDGVQTEWPVTFPFLRPEDVRAVVSGTGGDRVLAYGTDYTAAALPGGGGSVITIPGAPGMVGAGEQLTLWLDQPFTQEMDLRNTGVLDAEMLERGFDRLTLMAQQLREEVGRCVKVPLTDQTTRTDALLAGITVNVGRAEVAALNAGSRAADADAGAGRAEAARDGAETARAQAEAACDGMAQAIASAREDVLASAAFVPIGAILDFPVHTVPAGFLTCAGQTVTREAYPDLVAYLTGDPLALSATLPDLRGEFRRGADLGRGVDTGRVVGSAQGDAFQGHWHAGWVGLLNVSAGASEVVRSNGVQASANAVRGPQSDGTSGSPRIASETRPRNVAVVSCIKAYHAPMAAAPVDLSGVLAALDAIRLSGAEAKQPQTILRCRMGAPLAAPFHDLALPDFLSFSGLAVTLLADPANPFGVCFGNGGTSVTAQVEQNLAVTLPGAAATYWLYVERDPNMGGVTLGATPVAPEYGPARRGVSFIGNYTGYTGCLGTVAASSEYAGGGSPAWKALDGSGGAAGATAWYTASGVTSGWWRLTLDRKRRIRGYEMVGQDDGLPMPRAWNIKVTSDGETTTVDGVTGATWGAYERKRRLLAAPVACDALEVECLSSGREYVGMVEFVPIFDDDWYSPAENVMRDAGGAGVQRVYVGKAVVGGGAVTTVVPFHPGVEGVIPINNGGYLASAAQYTHHNPLGVPLADFPAVEIHDATAGRWVTTGTTRTSSDDVGCYGQAHAGDVILFRTFAGNRFWWSVAGSPLAYTTTYSRMRCRRAF